MLYAGKLLVINGLSTKPAQNHNINIELGEGGVGKYQNELFNARSILLYKEHFTR